MSILLPDSDENQPEEINYEATEKDEESFFLTYFMHIQPSECDALSDDKRKWLLARFAAQKQMEREMMMQQKIASGLDLGNLRV